MPSLGFELRDCQAWRDAGLPMSTTSNQCAKMYDASVSQLFGWVNDESLGGMEGTMKAMLQEDPNFVLGQVMGCYMKMVYASGLGLTKLDATLKETQKVVDLANKSQLNHREELYVEALKCLSKGNDTEAGNIWDDILVSYPTDRLALKICYDKYLFNGKMEKMRDTAGRVWPFWKKDMRQYGFIYGMRAFGLEETRSYHAAEKMAKLGCEWNKYDPFAYHCLSHVYEMTGRPDEGIKTLSSSEKDWTHLGGLIGHNYWHWGLFHVEKGEFDEALGIYDTQLKSGVEGPEGEKSWLRFCDGCSLLERLKLEGVNVGDRWDDVFEKARPQLEEPDHFWSFIDGHLMLAACCQPKYKDVSKRFLESAKKFVREQTSDNRNTMEAVGVPLMESIYEYEEGNYEQAVSLLYPVRYRIGELGGSEAQNDMFHLILIHAATKSPNQHHQKLARSMIAERQSVKENSPLNDRLMAKVVALH